MFPTELVVSPAPAPMSFSAKRPQASISAAQMPSCAFSNPIRSWLFRLPASDFRLLLDWLHFHSGLQQLQTGRDNFLAVLQTAFHNPFSFEKTTSLEVTAFDGIIGLRDEYVFYPLLRADHSVRDECSPIRRCTRDAHANKETRRNQVRVPVFYDDSHTHRPRPGIKAVVDEVDCAFVRKICLVSELDPRRDLGGARAHTFPFLAQLYIFERCVLVGIHFGVNRIDRDYCCKQALWTRPRLNDIAHDEARCARVTHDL